jgi:hypothetical protein
MPVSTSARIAPDGRSILRVVFAWQSDANGVATVVSEAFAGTLYNVEFAPGNGGSQPTNGYNLTLTTQSGVDILAGLGAGLSNASPTQKGPGVGFADGTTNSLAPRVINDVLTLNVSGAGASKAGVCVAYFR